MSNVPKSSRSARPTLPPLCTLGLPDPFPRFKTSRLNHFNESRTTTQNDLIHWDQSSVSSASSADSSSNSRHPSRSESAPSDHNLVSSSPADVSSGSFTLVRSTFADANAFVIVPPPHVDATCVPSTPVPSGSSHHTRPQEKRTRRGKALLLVGPATEYVRHPKRPLAKGVRIHPYRIVLNVKRRIDGSPVALKRSLSKP